ncbi:MAG TPA: DUF4440 domain-containing protein [Candidatus Polarisedimenticolaceae bacterium]|nr:DUF4440 domain-containing protein [Candidatus Polarisedimenticolaceae bacterium]
MNRRSLLAWILGAGLTGCMAPAADQSTKAVADLRAADAAWEKAFSSRDLDTAVGFVESGGSILAPNAPIATGPEAVRTLFAGFHAMPALNIHWQATRAEASKSGDLGFTSGTFELSFNDPAGNPVNDRGKYVTAWRKQADGSWKVVLDIFNSDLPPPGSAPH